MINATKSLQPTQKYRSLETTSTIRFEFDSYIDYGAPWSLFASFLAKIFIQFGFRKRLIRLF